MKRVLILTVVLLAMLGGLAQRTYGQDGIDVLNTDTANTFPDGIVFSINASAGAPFDDVRLRYRVAPDGVSATAVAQCEGTTTVSCNYQLGAGAASKLIPGAEITYSWRLVSGGTTQETPQQTITYEDNRFDWQTITDGNVTLWYYAGGEDEARAVLTAARESLERNSQLLQVTVDMPVKVFYYASAREMAPAIFPSEAQNVVTLGEVVYSDTAMVSADSAPKEIARHEVAHIVVRQAVNSAGGVPDWLNEGTAVYAQSRRLPGQQRALDRAIESGQVLSVRSISSASAGATSDRVDLFYGESWSLVDFLIRTYGEQKFADLFRAFDSGASTGDALQQVYGFNQDGLENAWRESVGLPPRSAPTPSNSQNAAPTPDESNTGASSSDSSGTNVTVIVIVIALTVLLAGSLVGLGVYLARRMG